ncbi:MAG: carboxynorspermidine decarboxylase [Desulfobulbaceae bacterium]|nr:carboxynorspermidine decarboxylase [Desulfobulbaceae bacterium]
MGDNDTLNLDLTQVPSPSFIVDQEALERNLAVLDRVQQATGAKVLLALKGFAMFSVFPLLSKVLHGTCASSIDEARLGREEFGGEVHTFSPAYSDETIREVFELSDHVVFNSMGQWQRYRDLCGKHADRVQFGLRINPEHSEVKTALYDPCRPGSRLGIRRQSLAGVDLKGISGLHFHTLCELDSHALERTLAAVERNFGDLLAGMKWVNFGGGHHISRPDYDVDHLCSLITDFQKKYQVEIYLEPGEAVALNAGIFVTTVLDIIDNDLNIAILDASASTHLPDVLEMPYRPMIIGGGEPGEKPYNCRLGGNSCLAGDEIGDYSFDRPLQVGDKLAFTDMAHYTMVKTTTFNGVRLPTIALYNRGELQIIKKFGYEDFKSRLS